MNMRLGVERNTIRLCDSPEQKDVVKDGRKNSMYIMREADERTRMGME